ncbi:MAG: hypothetical protein DRQ61_09045 [Gammaproteobacteria bacterium]|nr:MAG: hypothetical protein DRQ61_09045 [Gammaproteobacteria bacterium]
MADKSYIGKGKVHLDGRFIGNVSSFTYGTTEDKKTLADFTQGGGGNYNSVIRIGDVTIGLIMHDYSAENIAMALFGDASSVTSIPVADESVTTRAALDTLVKTADMIDTSVAPVVTSDPAGTTYIEDTDYTVSAAGITVLSTGSISASTALLISYTKKAVDVVQTLTNSGAEYQLIFDGLNEAQSGAEVVITVHRAKFGPASEVGAIGEDFAELALSGEALKDTSITTAGLSQYIEIKQAA